MRVFSDYGYGEIYDKKVLGEESIEEYVNSLRKSGKWYKYICKTIISGKYIECEIYPIYKKAADVPRADKSKLSRKEQQSLNEKNSQKKFVRYVNTNFGLNDLAVDLTYGDKYFPDERQARRDIQNYINRVKRYRKKNGLPELKYIYVIEFMGEDEKGKTKKVRVHHHIIMDAMDRDVAENIWGKGRATAERLQPDEWGLEGKARYISKYLNKGTKRWSHSKNLHKPKEFRSVTKLSNRKAEGMAKDEGCFKEKFEKMYKGKYIFTDATRYISQQYGGAYIYARMRRLE